MDITYYKNDDPDFKGVEVDVMDVISEALYENPQETVRIIQDLMHAHEHVLKVRMSDQDKEDLKDLTKRLTS